MTRRALLPLVVWALLAGCRAPRSEESPTAGPHAAETRDESLGARELQDEGWTAEPPASPPAGADAPSLEPTPQALEDFFPAATPEEDGDAPERDGPGAPAPRENGSSPGTGLPEGGETGAAPPLPLAAPRVESRAFVFEVHEGIEAVADLLPADRRVTLDLAEASVAEVLRMIAKAGALNLVAADGLDRRVSITLSDVTLREALATLLERERLRLVRLGDVLFVDAAPPPPPTAGAAAPPAEVSQVFRVVSVSAVSLKDQVQAMLSGDGKLVVNAENNTIFVRDRSDRVEDVARFVATVDRREKQVVIEARLFELTFERSRELGARIEFPNISFNDEAVATIVSNFLTPATNFEFGFATAAGNFEADLRALDRLLTVDLLSAPRVAAINGKEASIEILEKIPYVQSTSTFDVSGGGSTTATVTTVQFEEVGITLKVIPTIQEDRYVRMAVSPAVSEVKEFFNGVPVVDRRTVTTEVIVRDGGTLFIGGLLKESEREDRRKVPLLGDIPLLGALFRRVERTSVRTNLLVLLTPRIYDHESEEPGPSDHFRLEHRSDREAFPGPKRPDRSEP